MAAGDWEYHGVTQVRPADPESGESALYRVEALKSLWAAGKDPTNYVTPQSYVRVRIVGEWVPDLVEQFKTLSVTIDGVMLPDMLEGGQGLGDDGSLYEVPEWISPDSSLLRDMPFRRLFTQASAELRDREHGKILDGQQSLPIDYFDGKLPDFRELRKEWPKGDTRKVANWAGNLYMAAVADGQPATKAVEDAFGVSRSTAKRMVALARELGFIADHVVGAPGPTSRKGPTNEQGTT